MMSFFLIVISQGVRRCDVFTDEDWNLTVLRNVVMHFISVGLGLLLLWSRFGE